MGCNNKVGQNKLRWDGVQCGNPPPQTPPPLRAPATQKTRQAKDVLIVLSGAL